MEKASIKQDDLQILRKRMTALKNERSSWDAHWKELRDFTCPRRGRFPEEKKNDGSKKHGAILDSTPLYAVRVLAAGLKGGLTSPARPWFRLGVPDPDMMDFQPIKEWLYIVEERMRTAILKSNVYQALHHSYAELGVFGTASMSMLFDFDSIFRARPYTVGEYYLSCDAKQRVNAFYRTYSMTVSQIIEEFGIDNVSDRVKTAYNNNNTEQLINVCHIVEKNDNRLKLKDAQGRPFRAIYFEESESETVLRISGSEYFPVLAPRWDSVSGDVYGSSPAMDVLGDVKMLQKMQAKGMLALDKAIDPPLRAPGSLADYSGGINTAPGGVTFTPVNAGNEAFTPLYQVNPNFQQLEYKNEKVQAMINQGLYKDLFLMIANSETGKQTAFEVAKRYEEKLTMLGPVLDRLHNELLDPLIDITFRLMSENGCFPSPPPEIQGQSLRVEYISILAQAQKMSGITGLEQLSGFVGNIAAVKPEILDKIDFDKAVDTYGEILGVPPSIINSSDEVAKIRGARAQQMQQAQAAAQAQATAQTVGQYAQGAKTLSEVDTGGNNALMALLGGGR